MNRPPIVLVSGYADISDADVFNLGAEAFLRKLFERGELLTVVQNMVRERARNHGQPQVNLGSNKLSCEMLTCPIEGHPNT